VIGEETMMNWIKKAPTSVLIASIGAGVVVSLGFLAGFVVLALNGQDTTEYRGLVNIAMNAVTVFLGAIAAVGATSAAKSASNAEEQTNGTLTEKDREIAGLRRDLSALRDHGGR
jgi:hypothetical protein